MLSRATFRTGRTLQHPPETVFRAFSDGATLARWWGPEGFTNEFEAFEFKAGGAWTFVMVGPRGDRHPNASRFLEILPPSRLVIRHECAPFFTLTVELAPSGGGTQLTWTGVFDDPAVADAVRAIVEPANEQNLDRLEAVLAAGRGPGQGGS